MRLGVIVFLVLLLIPLSALPAFAVPIFEDDFSIDPEANGWTENFDAFDFPILDGINLLVPPHAGHGDEVIMEKNHFQPSPQEADTRFFSINRIISTVGFENIQISLTAHQTSDAFEPVDYLEISVDTNGDGIFESVLKDVEIWEGVEDQSTDDTGVVNGNFIPTSTGFIPLANAADNNPNLNIKIEAKFNSYREDYFLTDFEVIGDASTLDPDNDGDGLEDNEDNCPAIANADQADVDVDGAGDVCDACPNDAENDADGDGVCGDVDNCSAVVNADQADFDLDDLGDVCDSDKDGDGVDNTSDSCPATPNAGQEDNDGDGIGNACETMDISIIILDAINQVITLLLNPDFGLKEIKTEVAIIETEVLDTNHGLVAIKTAVDNIKTETDKIQMLKDDVELLKSQLTNMEEKIDTLDEFLVPPTPEEKALEKADKAQQKADDASPEKQEKEQAKACEKIQKEITKLEDKGITVPDDLQLLFDDNCS
jgi:hypothetical protein